MKKKSNQGEGSAAWVCRMLGLREELQRANRRACRADNTIPSHCNAGAACQPVVLLCGTPVPFLPTPSLSPARHPSQLTGHGVVHRLVLAKGHHAEELGAVDLKPGRRLAHTPCSVAWFGGCLTTINGLPTCSALR